jgi:MFS transporter, AAHS family, 4-hydroxybenzoate transporter
VTTHASEHTGQQECDLAAAISDNSFAGMPMRAWGILFLFLILDGLDLALLGLLSPRLAEEFQLSPASIGLLLGVQQAGVAVAGIFGGAAGDWLGRRAIIAFSVGMFGIFTVLAGLAPNVEVFVACRLLAGLGLGALSPNIASYLTETLPLVWRGRMTAAVFIAIALGAIGCSVLVKMAGASTDWRILFMICGVVPVIALPLLIWGIPESPLWMVERSRNAAAIAQAANRLVRGANYSAATRFARARPVSGVETEAEVPGGFLRSIPLRDTLCLWAIIFVLQFISTGMNHMGPTVLTANGLDLTEAARLMIWYNSAGLLGAIIAAWILPRAGSKRVFLVLGGAAIAGFAGIQLLFVHNGDAVSMVLPVALSGFAISGLSLVGFPLAASAYPTRTRSTGVGLAVGIGRVGSVFAPVTIGLCIATFGAQQAFIVQIPMALLLVAVTLGLRRHIAAVRSAMPR